MQEIMGDVKRRHHGDAVDTGNFAAVADLAHLSIEISDRLRELRALVLVARNLVFATEDRDVERQRRGVGRIALRTHSTGIRANNASRRTVACCTRSANSRLRACICASSLRNVSLATRSERVCASKVERRCSSAARSLSIAGFKGATTIGAVRAQRLSRTRPFIRRKELQRWSRAVRTEQQGLRALRH